MTTINAARVGWATYNGKDLIPRAEWDSYTARLNRYAIYQAYYDNTQYDAIEGFSARLKSTERLYKWVRGIYNPVKRENGLYVANVYKGTINLKDIRTGALPLEFDNDALEPALKQVLRWSNLGQQISMYVRYAALLGDAFWWVVDDPVRRRVRLELVHPSKVRDIEFDEVGNVRAAVMEYERAEDPQLDQYKPGSILNQMQASEKTYIYTLKVAKRDSEAVHFETFKDGEPFAYQTDGDGMPIADWDAPYGFVPLKPAFFEPGDDRWGANSWYAFRRQIDEINDQASIVNDTIRRVIEPLLKAKGLQKTDQITIDRDDRSGISILYISNKDGDIEAVQIPVDIGSAAANIDALQKELERNMPILALQRIREGSNLTAPGVQVGFSDGISQVENARQNLDPPLVGALQMAATIGGIGGYDGFAFDAGSYDRGEMELSITERAVVADSMTKEARITAYGTVANLPPALQRQALKDMSIPQDDIENIVADAEAREQEAIRAAARGFAQGVFGEDDEDPEEEEQAEEVPA